VYNNVVNKKCPKGHKNIRTIRFGKHAGLIRCNKCKTWYRKGELIDDV